MARMTQDTVRLDGPLALPPFGSHSSRWTLVLPVKRLEEAKSRLDAFAGSRRPELALAFALDTVTAVLACPSVERALVVTSDERAGRRLAAVGAVVVADEPGGGLNPALAHGVEFALRFAPDLPVATLSADLPALRPDELARVLAAVPATGRAFLADSPGTGTTLLACRPGTALQPAFGPGSRDRHAQGGAVELSLDDVPSVRRDVDTAADLDEALALGVGLHTAAVSAALR